MSDNSTAMQFGKDVMLERRRNGGAWTEVGGVMEFGLPQVTTNKVETTKVGASNGWKTIAKAFKELGAGEFTCEYTREAYKEAQLDDAEDEGVEYRFALENGDKMGFTALVTVNPQFKFKEQVLFKMTLDGSGELWWQEGGL